MISETLPKKKRFVATSNIFTAGFGSIVNSNGGAYGKYSFSIPANTQDVLKYNPNTVYLIERVSVGGNLAEEIFFDSIEKVPTLTLKNKIGGDVVYEKPINISGYKKNEDITTYITNQKSGDSLICSCDGILKQVAETIGFETIKLFVQFAIFAIDQNDFNKLYNQDYQNEERESISRRRGW